MWLILFVMFAPQPEDAYILALANDKRLEVQAPPQCADKLCTAVLVDGSKISLPKRLIDFEKTERLNREIAERRRLEAEAAAAAEAEPAEPEAEAEPKEVALTGAWQLPRYDRADSGVSGVEAPPEPEPLGPPRVNAFRSEDPVYVAKETITRYETHSLLEYEVMVNYRTGASNVQLEVKVNFANEAAVTLNESLGDLNFGETRVVTLRVDKADEILFTKTQLTGDLTTVR